MTWIVKVVSYDTEEIVKEIPCKSEGQAAKAERGVNINLNHDKYFTFVVNEEQQTDDQTK